MPVVQNIQKYLDEKRKQENLKKFLDVLQGTRRGIENAYDQGIVRGKNQPTTETWDAPQENKVSTSQLIGPKTQQEASAPPPRPEIPIDEGVSVDILGDISSSPKQVADVNRKANRQLADYLYGIIANEDVSSEQKQLGANMLSQIIKGEQPPEKKLKSFRPENTVFDEQGNIVQQGTQKEQKKTFKVSDDGYYLYWDDEQGGWVNTGQKAEKKANADQSLGWAKYASELEKTAEEKAKKEKEDQTIYNDAMGSEFVPMEDLLAQGKIEKNDPAAKYNPKTKTYKQGGAYIVRDKKGNAKLIFDDAQLKDYAKSQAPNAPNRWEREKNSSGKDKKKPKIEY